MGAEGQDGSAPGLAHGGSNTLKAADEPEERGIERALYVVEADLPAVTHRGSVTDAVEEAEGSGRAGLHVRSRTRSWTVEDASAGPKTDRHRQLKDPVR